jgi:8-oxo-dGTP pyrophosphatase MutT (NUDIX family)
MFIQKADFFRFLFFSKCRFLFDFEIKYLNGFLVLLTQYRNKFKLNNMGKEKDFYQISLKLLLKNSQGEILGLKGVDNGSYAGFYDLPGGRIDTDEFNTDFSKILDREIKEEIGNIIYHLNTTPVAVGRHLVPASMTSAKQDIHILYLFFKAEYIKGDLRLSNEHLGYKWFNLQDVELTTYFISGILEGINMYMMKNSRFLD